MRPTSACIRRSTRAIPEQAWCPTDQSVTRANLEQVSINGHLNPSNTTLYDTYIIQYLEKHNPHCVCVPFVLNQSQYLWISMIDCVVILSLG